MDGTSGMKNPQIFYHVFKPNGPEGWRTMVIHNVN